MNYESLSTEKKHILLDVAGRAIFLRPSLAGMDPRKDLSQKTVEFAQTLATLIPEPYAS